MTIRSRRRFLRTAAGSVAAAAAATLFPPSIQRALAIPAAHRSGSIRDIEHVVIFMQENRAFDHYFGTLRGVRGFNDRFPIPLPDGSPVWRQRDARGRMILPYHLDTRRTSAQRIDGTPHTWPDSQEAWNDGRMDRWLQAKTERSLGFYRRQDMEYQFALADAFTLCDAYHCSQQTGTNPNRLFLWTGSNDPAGTHGGPAVVNTFDDSGPATEGYFWTTYPERLLEAGISWKVYQHMEDNFSDNPLEGFRQYRAARPGSPLHRNALSTHTLDELARDAGSGMLPQVSWIVAPAKYSEHPGPSAPLWGAEYTGWVLDALTANPDVWARTALFVMFDENDGFFDHMPPPAPPAYGDGHGKSTVSLRGEHHVARRGPSFGTPADPAQYRDRAYGLGPRVPCYVISPFSRGGWVNSQVFDHTSVIRFLETRFGVHEPNISPWRRAVCGDLTSTLDFVAPNRELPPLPTIVDADGSVERQSRLPKPKPPTDLRAPRQESGTRRSRALPYALQVHGWVHPERRELHLQFVNNGKAGAVLHVYDLKRSHLIPRRYTVEAGKQIDDVWSLKEIGKDYELRVFGPNGFHRLFAGHADTSTPAACFEVIAEAEDGQLHVVVHNNGRRPGQVKVIDEYGLHPAKRLRLRPGQFRRLPYKLRDSGQWYDFKVEAEGVGVIRRLAGKVETGRHGISDPLM